MPIQTDGHGEIDPVRHGDHLSPYFSGCYKIRGKTYKKKVIGISITPDTKIPTYTSVTVYTYKNSITFIFPDEHVSSSNLTFV